MRKALLVLNIMVVISLATIFGVCYFAATHPILMMGAGILGINLVVLTMFKLG